MKKWRIDEEKETLIGKVAVVVLVRGWLEREREREATVAEKGGERMGKEEGEGFVAVGCWRC